MQSFPGAADFYVDRGRAVGAPTLLRLLRECRCNLLMSAMAYAAMDPRGRRRERRAWAGTFEKLSERCRPFYCEEALGYSVPVPPEDSPAVPDLSAAGAFSFQRLGSSRELTEAGKALENCLAEMPGWFAGDTVVAVRCGGAFVAAVALRKRQILQARAARNAPIEPDTPLGDAFAAWQARYGLLAPAPEPEFAE